MNTYLVTLTVTVEARTAASAVAKVKRDLNESWKRGEPSLDGYTIAGAELAAATRSPERPWLPARGESCAS